MKYTVSKIIVLAIFLGLFQSCAPQKYDVTTITAKNTGIDSSLTSDSSYVNFIAPFRAEMIDRINEKLTYTPKDLVRTDGQLQSTLGNLLADLTYQEANPIFKAKTGKNIDFAMFNYGGIRSGIFKGDVLQKHAFELMPFENVLVVVELSGEKMQELFNYFLEQQRAHPLSKQLQLTITKEGYAATIHQQDFNPSKSYYVLTSDYLQSGGDRMYFFSNPKQRISLDYKVRDAIIAHFKSIDTLKADLDQRIRIQR